MQRSVLIRTKPSTYTIGDVIQIDAILEHPMETGLRKDKNGKTIPAHFISNIDVIYANKKITTIEMSTSVSVNPFISFYVKVTEHAPLHIKAVDNLGEIQEGSKTL